MTEAAKLLQPPPRRPGRRLLRAAGVVMLVVMIAAIGLAVYEARTSRFQSRFLADYGRTVGFRVGEGPSPAWRYPGAGPFDERRGYSALPRFVPRLASRGFAVTGQARMSDGMMAAVDAGLFAPYREKPRAGLALQDCNGQTLFQARFPERTYARFEDVPGVLVRSLLFIENRELLTPGSPTKNPAVEWDRFIKAIADQAVRKIDADHDAHGGSTLATQIEKYRHSPEGRTGAPVEKLRQMASASLRAYLDGEDTTAVRRQLVVDYLNSVPLAAKPGYGEVSGMGDGLSAWYGRDFGEVNALLRDTRTRSAGRALAYKQALSLMIAQRRPSGLLADLPGLESLTNQYLRLLADEGVIDTALRDAALAQTLRLERGGAASGAGSLQRRKSAVVARTQLAGLLGVPRLYDLDRLDLSAAVSLDTGLQQRIGDTLRAVSDPAVARQAGLVGERMLGGGDPAGVIYSFTLFERTPRANLVRVQTDNYDQPFDINEGTKLDLGSTAKLRTFVTYLELMARLHARLSPLTPEQLAELPVARQDALTRWAVEYLTAAEDKSLDTMLEAALARRYSASPAEGFFTGGGLLTFENFDKEDDTRNVSVREGLQRSVNLVFIRLMRDIVRHVMFTMPGSSATLLDDHDDPKRLDYLARFADREGRTFIVRFFRKYEGKTAAEAEDLLLQGIRRTPRRLATIFRTLEPAATAARLGDFLDRHLTDTSIERSDIAQLYEANAPGRYDLADRGYLAGVHPLELWLVAYLRQHPGASLSQVVEASADQRQQVYRWLFKTRHKSAQDVRIKQLVEVEAFHEIHKMWQALGYPFDSLVPSYATALGSSADRPAALAELVGIVINDGVRLPTQRFDAIHFAQGTPYETRLAFQPAPGQRVLPPAVARLTRETMAEVVERGTARRLSGVFKHGDGSPMQVGGKTGTGDHRYEVYGKGGVLLSSRVVSRSGTLVFYIGDRHFGTLTAYVKGPAAAKYQFTSALPSQLLKVLAPTLVETIQRPAAEGPACTPSPAPASQQRPAA